MNAANADKSARLRRVLDYLREHGESSTLDIVLGAQVCAVNSCVSELRENGRNISCQRRGDIWYYRLTNGSGLD